MDISKDTYKIMLTVPVTVVNKKVYFCGHSVEKEKKRDLNR